MFERGQSVSLMELFIETLTGAAFEMKVHPTDTIHDVKARIQKTEGIPVTQQHLIWESTELADDCSLCDYNIQNHSTLKLVLTLRGGPINTRRISLKEDSSSYGDLDFDSDFGADDFDVSSLPFTVVVYHDGGRMKFYRILEWESSSPRLSDAIDEDEQTGGDGSGLKHKMDILRLKMEKVHLDRKMKKLVLPHPPSGDHPGNRSRQPFFGRSTSLFATSTPSSSSSSNTTSDEQTPNVVQSILNVEPAAAVENNLANGRISETLVDKTVAVPQSDVTVESVKAGSSASEAVTVSTSVPSDNGKQELSSSVQSQPKHSSAITNKQAEEGQKAATSKKLLSATCPAPSRSSLCSAHSMRTLQRVPETDVEEPSQCAASSGRPQSTDNMAAVSLTRRRRSPASSGRRSATTIVMETIDPLEVRSVLRSIVRSTGATGLAVIKSSPRQTKLEEPSLVDLDLPTTRRQVSVSGGVGKVPSVTAAPELPPVVKKPAKTVTRCFTCAKKTTLATSYLCRCGNNFCATHRYAEVHTCSYDYKGEGRKLLEQNNPLVTCPKLPKI